MPILPTFSAIDCRFLRRHAGARVPFHRLPAEDQTYLRDIHARLEALAHVAVNEYHGHVELSAFLSPTNAPNHAKGTQWAGVRPQNVNESLTSKSAYLQLEVAILPEGIEITFGRNGGHGTRGLPAKPNPSSSPRQTLSHQLLHLPVQVIARLERSLPGIWKFRKQRRQPGTTSDFTTLSQWIEYAASNAGHRACISIFIDAEALENDTFDVGAMFLEANRLFEPLLETIYGSTESAEEVSLVEPIDVPQKETNADCDFARITTDFADALQQAHLVLGARHLEQVKAFLASVATKPFVILTGLSGSGKTQLALRFGDWIGRDHVFVAPVRPDWTGAEALFGYEDALQPTQNGSRAWHVPDTLEFLLTAANDPSSPYLLVLDEMNLAHVERYFADFLSGMETGQPCLPNLVCGDDGCYRILAGAEKMLPMPKNLFVIGTVNIDETTYLFSPKVLDRANTIDFRVQTEDLDTNYIKPVQCREAPKSLARGLLQLATDESFHVKNPAPNVIEFATKLRQLHSVLSEYNLEFGHRLFYEATRFAALFAASGIADPYAALDRQILQKILPRLHGSRRKLEMALCALAAECVALAPTSNSPGNTAQFDPLLASTSTARMPLSLAKIQRMLRSLRLNQFTSFSE